MNSKNQLEPMPATDKARLFQNAITAALWLLRTARSR